MTQATPAAVLLFTLAACSDMGGPSGFPIRLVSGDHLVVQTVETDDPPRSNPAAITGARLDHDELALDVRYSGGCRTHRFAAFTDGKQGLSNPPFVMLYLAHDSGNDRCEAAVSRTLFIDLSPLKTGSTGTLLVRLVQPDGTRATIADVIYQF